MAKETSVVSCEKCKEYDHIAKGDKLCGTCLAAVDKREKPRDEAANAALTGMLMAPEVAPLEYNYDKMAKAAYAQADAMLAEREKGGKG